VRHLDRVSGCFYNCIAKSLHKVIWMKIVQVPMDEKEAKELAALASGMRISRADLIRRACRKYVDELEEARLDAEYARGYREIPEDPAFGEACAALLAMTFPHEDWS